MIRRILVVLFLVVLSSSAWSATQQNKITWDDLTVEEQELLQPFQEKWDFLPPGQQWRLMKGASR